MERRFVITHVGPGGNTTLARSALPEQVRPILVDDLRGSDFLKGSPNEDRDPVFEAATAMNYIYDDGPFPEDVTLCGRTYRIERLRNRKFVCPKCKQKTGVNIEYGYPDYEKAEQAERQEIVLGGCILEEDQPDRHCFNCDHEWQIVRKPDPWDIPDFL